MAARYQQMSFNYHARKVRNPSLPFNIRCSSLGSCILRLGWLTKRKYLATRSRFVDDSTRLDEERLLAAMAAIEIERNRFLEQIRSFERKRIREKLRGRRSPRPADVAALYQIPLLKEERPGPT
jgi:hypothetical protein